MPRRVHVMVASKGSQHLVYGLLHLRRAGSGGAVKGCKKYRKLHRQEALNSVGGRKVNVPDTTAEVRHDRNYSSRTFYIDLFRGSHKVFRQELPRNPPGRTCTQAGCQLDPHKIFSQGPVRIM